MLASKVPDPNIVSGLSVIIIAFVAGLSIHRFLKWIADAPLHPDPWEPAVTEAINQPDAVEVCLHCDEPAPPLGWFCPQCGNAVGPYNNLMPYLRIFSEGEVLRNGFAARSRLNVLIVVGYFLVTLISYTIFAPAYWVVLFLHLRRRYHAGTEITAGETPDG